MNVKRLFILFIVIFIFSQQIFSQTQKPKVIVGYYDFQGIQEISKDGKQLGSSIDYLNQIAQYAGFELEYINESEENCYSLLNDGSIDLVNYVLYNEENAKKFSFTAFPSAIIPISLFVSAKNYIPGLEQLKNKSINVGIMEKFTVPNDFIEIMKVNNISVTYKKYNNQIAILSAVTINDIDAILAPTVSSFPGMYLLSQFSGFAYYLAVNKNKPELTTKINNAINTLSQIDPMFSTEILHNNLNSTSGSYIKLTQKELNYLKSKKKLTVSYDPEYYPMEYTDPKTGEFKGISRDLFDQICSKLNLELEIVKTKNYTEAKQMLAQGKIDALGVVATNDITSMAYNSRMTPVYQKNPIIMLSLNNDNKDFTSIALPEDSFISLLIAEKYPNKKKIFYSNNQDCLDAVYNKKADVTFVDAYEASYLLSSAKYQKIHTTLINSITLDYLIAVSNYTDLSLFTSIVKALSTISDQYITEKLFHYSSLKQNVVPFEQFYKNPPMFIIIIIIIVCIILSITFLILNNITKIKKNLELEKLSNAKSNFLSRMSHEIRTPLSTIIGINNIQKQNLSNPDLIKDCSQKIDIASHHLLELLNDILDMSKINEGMLTLSLAPFSIDQMLNVVFTVYQENAKTKNINLICTKKSLPNKLLIGDELRIRQILINLVSNAIKYNKKNGSIELIAEGLNETSNIDSNSIKIKFSVCDTGLGISDNEKEKLFFSFERTNSSIQTSESGTGLGLSISQSLAHLMNSEIKVESTENVGSTFSFELVLPISENEVETKQQEEEINLSNKQILIAEDNQINASIIKYMLKRHNAIVSLAENGEEVITKFMESKLDFYDVILMDIQMPLKNGYEATQAIRQSNRSDAKKVVIIALSANAFSDDIQKSINIGMNAHCSKPIDPDNLINTINNLLNNNKTK